MKKFILSDGNYIITHSIDDLSNEEKNMVIREEDYEVDIRDDDEILNDVELERTQLEE